MTSSNSSGPPESAHPTDGDLQITSLDSHVVRAPRYVVRDWRGLGVFPVGATIIAGKQGSGKSTLLRKVFSDFTSGQGSFRGESNGRVLYVCWEDDRDSSILPEMAVNYGDVGKVSFLSGVRHGAASRQWQMDDLDRIEQYCAANPEVRIVVVDTLTALSNTIGRNSRGARAAGSITTSLHQFGLRLGIAVVIVCHMTKLNRRGGALDAIAGSTELTSGPRAVWLVGQNPSNMDYRSMVLVKHNLTGLTAGFTFRTNLMELPRALELIHERGLRTEGELDPSMFVQVEILPEEEMPSADAVYRASVNLGVQNIIPALDRAVQFFRQLLEENNGCMPTATLMQHVTTAGFSSATITRARNFLRESGEIQTFQSDRLHFVATSGFDRENFIASRRAEGAQVLQATNPISLETSAIEQVPDSPPLPPGGQFPRFLDL